MSSVAFLFLTLLQVTSVADALKLNHGSRFTMSSTISMLSEISKLEDTRSAAGQQLMTILEDDLVTSVVDPITRKSLHDFVFAEYSQGLAVVEEYGVKALVRHFQNYTQNLRKFLLVNKVPTPGLDHDFLQVNEGWYKGTKRIGRGEKGEPDDIPTVLESCEDKFHPGIHVYLVDLTAGNCTNALGCKGFNAPLTVTAPASDVILKTEYFNTSSKTDKVAFAGVSCEYVNDKHLCGNVTEYFTSTEPYRMKLDHSKPEYEQDAWSYAVDSMGNVNAKCASFDPVLCTKELNPVGSDSSVISRISYAFFAPLGEIFGFHTRAATVLVPDLEARQSTIKACNK